MFQTINISYVCKILLLPSENILRKFFTMKSPRLKVQEALKLLKLLHTEKNNMISLDCEMSLCDVRSPTHIPGNEKPKRKKNTHQHSTHIPLWLWMIII